MILSAQTINRLSNPINLPKPLTPLKPLIQPFQEEMVLHGMTAELSCCGYDVKIDQDVTLYPTTLGNLLLKACGVSRPSFSLASTVEQFNIPNHLAALVMDKSTWARRGLAVQNTILEPGWSGYITLELSCHGDNELRIKKGSPIAQVIFVSLDFLTQKPYSGKYNQQKRGPQPAILA